MKKNFDLINLYKKELISLNNNIPFFLDELNGITKLNHTSINKENLLHYFNVTRSLNKNDEKFYKAGICLSALIGEFYRKKYNGSFALINRVTYNERIPYYTITIIYDDRIYFVQEDFLRYYYAESSFLQGFFNYRESGYKSFEHNYNTYKEYNDIIFIE